MKSKDQFYSAIMCLLCDASDTLNDEEMLQLANDLGPVIDAHALICRKKIEALRGKGD